MKGYKLVVVVSALGRKPDPYATDTLLDMVNFPANHNSSRELDLLLSCGETIASVVLSNELQKHHITATALTGAQDRKSTRLNSSHVAISYAVFCLKKKKKLNDQKHSPPPSEAVER